MEKQTPNLLKRLAKYSFSSMQWISLIGAFTGMIASVLNTFLIERPEKALMGKYYIVLIVASVVLILLTFFVSIVRRGPKKIAKLKSELERSFLNSLDSSELNPKRKEMGNV
jgi:uncharacterized membrane protein